MCRARILAEKQITIIAVYNELQIIVILMLFIENKIHKNIHKDNSKYVTN